MLIIAKHMVCHVNKHSPDSRKENTLSLLTGLGMRYCCILLPQIRPQGKVLCLKLRFAHTRRGLQMWFRPHFTESKFISPKSTRNGKYWQTNRFGWKTRSVISVSAKFQAQTLCCLPGNSKMYRSRTVMFAGQRFEFN